MTAGFWDRHRDILDWLHMSYGVEVYGVEVSVWRIGDAVAHYFELAAGANASEGSAASSQLDNGEPEVGHRAYGRYYRPLTANLNGEGIHAIGGRWGGWTGSFRSFRTSYEEDGIVYGLQIGDRDGKSWIWLRILNDDHRTIYNALSEHRSEIDQEMVGHTLQWETSTEEGYSWVGMSTDATIDDGEEKLEATRSWMFDGLSKLRMALQPRLDEVMA